MRKQRLLSLLMAAFMLGGQLAWPLAAAADEATPSPTPEATASPSPSPEASTSPSPSASPEASPSPSASPSPEASASPSPSPSPDKKDRKHSPEAGADGCGGVVPNWVFDTVSRTWVEADKASFSCDKASGYYLSPKYYFDKRIGWYEIIPVGSPAAAAEYMITAPNVVHTVLGDLVVGSKDYEVAKAFGLLGGSDGLAGTVGVGATGAGSSNTAQANSGSASWFDMTNLVNVINTLQSNASSGNVNATANTQVGNAVSGAATVIANLVNLLTSAWSWSNGNLNFFFKNILEPTTGDINLNFVQTANGGGGSLGASIDGTGAGSNNVVGTDNSNTLNVNAKDSGNIVNNVNLNAQSGNVDASKNTGVGNLASGTALAEVNIINLINSYITSGSSFFGVLNIFSNLNGDILFPQGFLNGLIGSGSAPAGSTVGINGTGANSTNGVGIDNSSATNVNATAQNTVANNINTAAASGSAGLTDNTKVGNVATGNASTNSSLFNLSGQSIFGDNAVLVIVNVMGHWIGKFMDVSGGSTGAALLTGNASVGVNNTGANSNNAVSANNSDKTNANLESSGTITNNVNVNAQSGDVNADKNTSVGDVATGDAHAASNTANIFNSVLNVKHWFGVLVINVLGDWVGDVNHDSEAGGMAGGKGAAGMSAPAASQAQAPQNAGAELPKVGLLAFVTPSTAQQTVAAAPAANGSGKVLTAAAQTPTQAVAGLATKNMGLLFAISAIVMLLAGALLTIDKKLKRR